MSKLANTRRRCPLTRFHLPDLSPKSEKLAAGEVSLGVEGLIPRAELVRVIVQSLYSLGYRKAAAALELESGVRQDSPEFGALVFNVVAGRWDDCVATIDSIEDLDKGSRAAAAFLLWKEHFLELLGLQDGVLMAKVVLEERIAPLDMDRRRVHRLAGSLISMEGVIRVEDWFRRRIELLLDLSEMLPPWVRVPGGRLDHLVEMAALKQLSSCIYHNLPSEFSLYEDHRCSQEQIPYKCNQILDDHKNEVWFVQFSHNGDYLASTSSDCTAIIWKVNSADNLSPKHILKGHSKPISFAAWSPDDTMLLTCGNGEVLKLWDVCSGTCKLTYNFPVDRVISSCAWFPDSRKIACGSYEPDNRIFICDLEGNEMQVWEGERMPKVSDLAVTPDGRLLISICSSKEIHIYDFLMGKERVMTEDNSITSLCISRDGRALIVNLNSEEIHLWNIVETSEFPAKFKGHKQGKYVIRSCFGGSDSLFIASGSEDAKIYVWQQHHETPIKVLSGHTMTVNCVSWNPTRLHMLASASYDNTVRIWVGNKSPS